MKKQKGFTLIELLAVIVILAVIALIATPIIIGIINDAKEKANENSAYGIVDSANYYFTNGMLKEGSVEYNTNILNSLTYNGQAPKEGSAVYVNEQGQVAVALLYGDKCYKKEYTDSKISLGDIDNCTVLIPSQVPKEYTTVLGHEVEVVKSGSGLYKITDTEYRYRGGTVDNYIQIGDVLYRILAVSGNGIKVIRAEGLPSNLSFDVGQQAISKCNSTNCPRYNSNNTYCQNAVDAQSYYGGCNAYAAVSGTFTSGNASGTVTQNSSLYDYLNNTGTDADLILLRKLAQNVAWNVGSIGQIYEQTLEKVMTEEKAKTATFKIGLVNVSDYLFTSLNPVCQEQPYQSGSFGNGCIEENWLYNSEYYQYTLNPKYNSGSDKYHNANSILTIDRTDGKMVGSLVYGSTPKTRPTAYLSSSTVATGGTGTASDPWIINIPA